MTGEKTTKASLTSKFTLPDSTLAGAKTPYNLLNQLAAGRRTRTPFIQLLLSTNRKGLQPLQAYNVGPSTNLPPYNDKNREKKEETQDTIMNCLISMI